MLELVEEELKKGTEPSEIIDKYLIAAINYVGELFEQKKYFLPQLIASAETMEKAINRLEPLLEAARGNEKLATIVVATVKGDIHDIGKRFGCNSYEGVIPHAINGYNYLKSLGYDDKYAGICIKHSFLNNDINCLANDRDYTDSTNEKYNFIKNYILKQYTIYEKIINLCDLMCTTKLQSLEQRLIDLLLRHGVYKNTHYHLIEVYKLKENLDNLLGYNLYNLFPEIKENL